MATLRIYPKRILSNIKKLQSLLKEKDVHFTLVAKMLNGNKRILEHLLFDDAMKGLHSVGDARLSNLKAIREVNPNIKTMYIKPPSPLAVEQLVRYADISLNSSLRTIEEINREAGKQGKVHQIIVMVEMGELREGIQRDKVLYFYDKVFQLANIEVIGLGTNLGCMYGIEPTYDKLIQLSLYEQLIEAKFGKNLEVISAGSSITLPMLGKTKLPKGLNHFRIGEAAFLGVTPIENKKYRNLSTNAIEFAGEILELEKKSNIPDGNISEASIGHIANDSLDETDLRESYRAIMDFGVLDVDVNDLYPKDKSVRFFGTTSDMTVYDLGDTRKSFKVGSVINFWVNYMAVARLLNSRYMSIEIKNSK